MSDHVSKLELREIMKSHSFNLAKKFLEDYGYVVTPVKDIAGETIYRVHKNKKNCIVYHYNTMNEVYAFMQGLNEGIG